MFITFVWFRGQTSQSSCGVTVPDSNVHWPTWGPPGSCWPQMGPMLAPWTLLSRVLYTNAMYHWPVQIGLVLGVQDCISSFLWHWPTTTSYRPILHWTVSINNHDSKGQHGANMGPIWDRQDPGGPHVGPMNFAIWEHRHSSTVTQVGG